MSLVLKLGSQVSKAETDLMVQNSSTLVLTPCRTILCKCTLMYASDGNAYKQLKTCEDVFYLLQTSEHLSSCIRVYVQVYAHIFTLYLFFPYYDTRQIRPLTQLTKTHF